MASRDEDLFDIYVRTYGKVQSGTKLDTRDYGTQTMEGFVAFPTDGKAAVAMAAEDVKFKVPMRSMPDMLNRLRSLMGNSDQTSPSPASSARAARSPSATMIGDWRQIRPLRRDGQGEVLLVIDEQDGRGLGVLKRIPKDVSDDPKRLLRFKHEIQIAQKLRHPFIAPVLDTNLDGDMWFVTQFAAYGSLVDNFRWLKGDAWRALRMGRDIASALQAAHTESVIHRDVKPGNVLMYNPDHFALTDFGIAHRPDHTKATDKGEKVGPGWFLPPEAEHGRPDDVEPIPSHDVYMLGKLVYYTFTGGRQFIRERFADGDANIETMFGRPELAILNKRLFARMIIEDPAYRFRSMDAVIAAIDDVLATLFGARSSAPDPHLVFTFTKSDDAPRSGDHLGLAMVPVWLPRAASQLIIDIVIMQPEAVYSIELWNETRKVVDSGQLKQGRHMVRLPENVGGNWYKLRVKRDTGWGTTHITSLIVHSMSEAT